MTVIATALKHLMAAGVTGDALIAAIAEIEAALPGAQPAEPTRSKAAIRQERYRRNKASQNVTNGITNVTQDNENVTSDAERNTGPLPLPPNDLISNPPTPAPEKTTPRARGKHRLPDDWTPKPLTGDTAMAVANWPNGAVERELARFRDWAAGGGPNTRKEDWDATWRNWLRRAHDEGRYRNATQQRNGPASTIDAVQRAFELTGDAPQGPAAGSQGGDNRIGQVSDPLRSIGYVER